MKQERIFDRTILVFSRIVRDSTGMSDIQNKISATLLRVYFLGSGAIAVPALRALLGFPTIDLVGCGTQPDRPQGRRRQPSATPVGAFCAENGVPVDKPVSAKDPEFLTRIEELRPDLILVFAFGQILGKRLLELPPLGCVNLHASLLPRYRGASPVNAAILAGDSRTGISVMRMTRGLDAGPVYTKFETRLDGTETAAELIDDLAELAGAHVCGALEDIKDGRLQATPQPETDVSYASKISKVDGAVDWHRTAEETERMVRGYYPWPGAFFFLRTDGKERKITITQATIMEDVADSVPGSVVQADKFGWTVACGSGVLRIKSVIPAGKKEMTGTDFLMGCPLQTGTTLTYETDDCKL
jgi:methionyl-tRNA formyltransferase